ncbi:MAG: hypothetical protein DMG08_11060 [Acidobacteria bacterium]|nr:MAG: hypothetical protein DMG08_11060 [Acidobacteriota bacterium]
MNSSFPAWKESHPGFTWERRYPVHHEDTKTRRIAKDFFASSCLRGEFFLVVTSDHNRIFLHHGVSIITRLTTANENREGSEDATRNLALRAFVVKPGPIHHEGSKDADWRIFWINLLACESPSQFVTCLTGGEPEARIQEPLMNN